MLFSQPTQPRFTRTATFAVLLTLWLSFAYIDHQFDTISDHHNHHDCQQFSCIQFGLSTQAPLITPAIVHGYTVLNPEPIKVQRPTSAYLARSPPMTALRHTI